MKKDYQRIEKAILFLEQNYAEQPGLDELSNAIHLSPYHLQRLFKRWAGVTPKQFLQSVTLKHANSSLRSGATMLSASEQVGFSSTSRLHDLYINLQAMSPAQYRNKGQGLQINYGLHDTPFGNMIVGETENGICSLFFTDAKSKKQAEIEICEKWSNAKLNYQAEMTQPIVDTIFTDQYKDNINLLVGGTNFQIKVWQALLNIPFGEVRNYGQIADSINAQGASRAVGTAVSKNPIAYLIPCHRVIRSTGVIGEYHWGAKRKKAILTWEQCRLSA